MVDVERAVDPRLEGRPNKSLRRDLAALAVTLTVLVPMLAGCAGISGQTVGDSDLHVFVHDRTLGPPSGGMAAEVTGALGAASGCVVLDQDGDQYPVVWPSGTEVADTDPLVIELPSAEQLQLGEQVRGGGGYLKADTLDIDVPAACLNEYGEVAVFNPDDDPTVVESTAGTSGDAPPLVELRALSQTPDVEVRARGYVVNDGDGWLLCEEQNESHPPSCNGDNVRLSDYLGPQDVIATEGDVSWSHIPVTIAGVFDSGDLAFVPAEERD